MGQIVGSILGIKEACEALKTPVVSGNVSLYNETDGSSILPTPVIGMIGLVKDLNKIIKINSNKDQTIYLIGQSKEKLNGFLQSSLYQEIFFASFEGQVPPINLKQEKKIHDFILKLDNLDIIKSANDVSEGGFLPCLLEMLFSKQLGISINIPSALGNLNKSELYKLHGWLFGEDQGRILISTTEDKIFEQEAKKRDIKFYKLGITNASGIVEIGKYDNISINECYKLYDKSLSDQVS